MQQEVDSLSENKVWKLAPKHTTDKPIIKARWVFTPKLGADGAPVQFKAGSSKGTPDGKAWTMTRPAASRC